MESLEYYENEALEGANMLFTGVSICALAVHKILTNELWRQAVDDLKMPVYGSQEEYISYLQNKLGLSRATIFNYNRSVTAALGAGWTIQEYADKNGYTVFNRVLEHVQMDRNGNFDQPKQLVLEIANEIASVPEKPDVVLPPAEQHKLIASKVNSRNITFFIEGDLLMARLHGDKFNGIEEVAQLLTADPDILKKLEKKVC